MTCTPIRLPGGGAAIVCTRGQRRHRCQHPGCGRIERLTPPLPAVGRQKLWRWTREAA